MVAKSGELCIIGQEKSKSNLRLLEEAKKVFDKVLFTPIDGIGIGLSKEFLVRHKSGDIFKFNAFLPRIPRDYYSYAYQLFSLFPQEAFMPIKPISFLLASERFFLLTVLRKRDVPTLNLQLARSPTTAASMIKNIEFPVIIRVPGKKTGIISESVGEAKSVIDALGSLKQPVLMESVVKDMVSVYVADPEVIGSVKKKTKEKDIVFGKGDLKKHKPGIEVERLALDAIHAVDSQIGRADIALDPEPRIVNIDLNPGLINPSRVTGVNMAQKIIQSIQQNYKEHQEKPLLMKFFDDAKSVVKDVLKSKSLI